MTETPIADMTFEEALKRLEGIVKQLESAEVPLEQSIQLYEEGARLKARCEDCLRRAQERIELIRVDESGAAVGTTPFAAG